MILIIIFQYSACFHSFIEKKRISSIFNNAFEIIDPKELNGFRYKKSFLISGIETIGIDKSKWFSSYIKDTPIEFQTGKESIKIQNDQKVSLDAIVSINKSLLDLQTRNNSILQEIKNQNIQQKPYNRNKSK